jgi:hypothetical protein
VSRIAVVGTFYRRPWAIEPIRRMLSAQSRRPDEVWLAYEDDADLDPLLEVADDVVGWSSPHRQWDPPSEVFLHRVMPKAGENPLGLAINWALDRAGAEYITYLTDDSSPTMEKYRLMAKALDENPDWGAVYCSQDYGTVASPEEWLEAWDLGSGGSIRQASDPEPEPFCRVDHTQVMHRATLARWPESYDDRKLSDAHFFRDLVADLGPLMPVPEVLDWTRQLPDGLSRR